MQMNRFRAATLWPYVYILDVIIGLIDRQTFKESRSISKSYFKRIMKGDKTSN